MRLLSLLLVACSTVPDAQVRCAPPAEELGLVRWPTGVDEAIARSKASGRPALVLFDEVPGCGTVLGFGQGALSNPLIAEAIETLFEPALVYNNTPEDAATCARFGEPRWNNPVVDVLDGEGATTARFAGPYDQASFARFLVGALEAPPPWLSLVADELSAAERAATATYSMACFWSGEAHLGLADGVLRTKTGRQGGREVVQVRYDPVRIDASTLTRHARKGNAVRAPAGVLSPTPATTCTT